jgi:hypothetical protein
MGPEGVNPIISSRFQCTVGNRDNLCSVEVADTAGLPMIEIYHAQDNHTIINRVGGYVSNNVHSSSTKLADIVHM